MSSEIILLNSFPSSMNEDVKVVLEILNYRESEFDIIDSSTYVHYINNEIIIIPYRVYFKELSPESIYKLTDMQKKILYSIFLLHHNGFIRQRYFEKLTNLGTEYWMMPFIFKLLGEYVIEIILIIDLKINEERLSLMKQYMKENPKFYQLTKSRIVSYWDVYYSRRFPNFKKYPGKLIIDKLEK